MTNAEQLLSDIELSEEDVAEIYKAMKKERGGGKKIEAIRFNDKTIIPGERSGVNGNNAVVSKEIFSLLVEMSSNTKFFDIPESIREDFKIFLSWLEGVPIAWFNSVIGTPEKISVPEHTLFYDSSEDETPTLSYDEESKIECTFTIGDITVKRRFSPDMFTEEQGATVEKPYAIEYKHHFISYENTCDIEKVVSRDLFNTLVELSLSNKPILLEYNMVGEMERFIVESIGEITNDWFIRIAPKGIEVAFPASTKILSKEGVPAFTTILTKRGLEMEVV